MAGDVESMLMMINLSFDIIHSEILSVRTAGDQSELIIGSPTDPSLMRSRQIDRLMRDEASLCL